MENIFDQIVEEDLTPDLRMIADVCGIEIVKKLLIHFSGINFYIPKISRLEGFILKYLSKHENLSHNEIAKELNVSGQFIKKLQKKKIKVSK
jgi:hypothetical protein